MRRQFYFDYHGEVMERWLQLGPLTETEKMGGVMVTQRGVRLCQQVTEMRPNTDTDTQTQTHRHRHTDTDRDTERRETVPASNGDVTQH